MRKLVSRFSKNVFFYTYKYMLEASRQIQSEKSMSCKFSMMISDPSSLNIKHSDYNQHLSDEKDRKEEWINY